MTSGLTEPKFKRPCFNIGGSRVLAAAPTFLIMSNDNHLRHVREILGWSLAVLLLICFASCQSCNYLAEIAHKLK